MSDRWAVALALCAAMGATRPSPVPLGLALVVVAASLVARWPWLLCVGALLLVSSLATRSLNGLDGVVPGPVAAEVTLLSDPTPSFGGVRADARLGHRRVELRADGTSADALRPRLAGERLDVRGALTPAAPDASWLISRHVAGRLQVHALISWRPGGTPGRIANALRRTLVRGASPLSPVQRSLYTGLVIGDDRYQPAELADDFLGAGLTHLLAVSGQNVAFALALAGPLLRRLRIWPRLFATLAVIAMFGLMTRFEPSVLRAAAMAATATAITTTGTSVTRLRVIALAVTGLLVADPLLIRSVGFQLSTAAAAAIVLLAPPLAEALPGPPALREALSVTVAAQLGVAPVLLAAFGPLPLASFPANLLAVPAAGPVMVWGLTAGMVAGVAGAGVAAVVHLPTRVLLAWLAGVAARSAALPLGALGAPQVGLLAAGLVGATWGWSHRRPGVRRAGLVVAGAVVAAVITAAQAPPPLRSGLAVGLVRWHHGATDVVVLGGAGGRSPLGAATVLADLRQAGVGSIDLLVVADVSVDDGVLHAIEARHPLGATVTSRDVAQPGAVVAVGSLDVHLTPAVDRLVVEAVPSTG
jgi:competence protein ComEC